MTTAAQKIDDMLVDAAHLEISERDLRNLNWYGKEIHTRGITAEQIEHVNKLYIKYVGEIRS